MKLNKAYKWKTTSMEDDLNEDSRRLKLGIQLDQTKPNPNLKNKNL